MIKSLKLIHFKSHKQTTINVKGLTVLCGPNGVGKSSFIQSLLLLRQTYFLNKLDSVLFLNGRLYEIGTVRDALHVSNEGEFYKKIAFEIEFKDSEINNWLFDADSDFNFLQLVNKDSQNTNYSDLALFKSNFHYISAFRSSDQTSAKDFDVVQEKQISYDKGKGDMVAHYLHFFGDKVEVIEKLRHPDSKFPFLKEQVSAWESDIISSGLDVVPEKVSDAQYDIRYNFNVKSIEVAEHNFSAVNVGYGLSYILPIIVAILTSEPGALIIIENPEAHLHPHSISKLTELLSIASQAGIQIIIETHSDHVINGILVQTKRFEDESGITGVDRENVSIYQFDRNENQLFTTSNEITIDAGGRIFQKPEGFFDQIATDLRDLL